MPIIKVCEKPTGVSVPHTGIGGTGRRPRRLPGRGKGSVVDFLVKWKISSPYGNSWYDSADLPNAKEAIADSEKKYGEQSVKEYQKSQRKKESEVSPDEAPPPSPEPPRRQRGRPRKNVAARVATDAKVAGIQYRNQRKSFKWKQAKPAKSSLGNQGPIL